MVLPHAVVTMGTSLGQCRRLGKRGARLELPGWRFAVGFPLRPDQAGTRRPQNLIIQDLTPFHRRHLRTVDSKIGTHANRCNPPVPIGRRRRGAAPGRMPGVAVYHSTTRLA